MAIPLGVSVQSPAAWANKFNPVRDAAKLYGLIGDDSSDNTSRVADMFDSSGRTLFLLTPGTYRTGKFSIPSNTRLYLAPGVILKDTGLLDEALLESFCNLETVSNIHVIGWGAQFLQTRSDYATGEHRHGLRIYGSDDIIVEGLECSDTGGDGFYIGGDAGDGSERVHLYGIKADNNRRQGLSLVSARTFRCVDGVFTSSNGTAPSAGIDIEPNSTSDSLEDIVFVRPRCKDNDGAGIAVFLGAFGANSSYVDITIQDPYTRNNGAVSQSGSVRPGIDLRRVPNTTPCRGRIRIINADCFKEQRGGISVWDWDVNGPRVELVRPEITSPNQAQGSTGNHLHGCINLYNSGTYTSTPGNVHVYEPIMRDDDGYLAAQSYSPLRIVGTGWDNVEIVNPSTPNFSDSPWSIDDACGSITFRSDTPQEVAITGNTTISDGRYLGRLLTNYGAAGGLALTFPAAAAGYSGWRFDIEVRADQTFAITPNAADKIRPLADAFAAGTVIRCSMPGGRISLQCRRLGTSSYAWVIVHKNGVWAIDPGSGDLTAYTMSNSSADRALDCRSGATIGAAYSQTEVGKVATKLDEAMDVLATVVKDLKERGLLA